MFVFVVVVCIFDVKCFRNYFVVLFIQPVWLFCINLTCIYVCFIIDFVISWEGTAAREKAQLREKPNPI